MLIVVLENKTFIFSFMNLKLIEQVETGLNTFGICGVATAEQAILKTLALPCPTKGSIRVLNYGKSCFVSNLIYVRSR
jgi:WD repeat-containing protein 45